MQTQIRRFGVIAVLLVSFLTLPVTGVLYAQEKVENEDAVEIFNSGQDAHEKGDLQKAIELYQKALAIIPEFPEAEYQLGTAYVALNDNEKAEAAFRRAIKMRDDWTLPMTALGSLLVQKEKNDEARIIIRKALELDPTNSSAYVALTDLYLQTKATPEELRDLLAKIRFLTSKANPIASLWSARGAIERKMGETASAKTSVERALQIEPSNRAALAERVEIAILDRDFAGAVENARLLLKLAPENPNTKFLLARALAENGETDASLKIIDTISNPRNEVKLLREAIVAASSANIPELEKQLENAPNNAAVLGRLCNLLRTENPLKALEYCKRAAEAEPANLGFVIGYGAALVQAKQFPAAVGLFRKIIDVAPDNYTAHANLAISLFQLKRFEEAKVEYRWIAEKQPNNAIAFYFLAIVHDQLTEYLDAMANYQLFLRLADTQKNKLEIEKVNLRLPGLQKQIKEKKGKR